MRGTTGGSMDPIVELRQVTRDYALGRTIVHALRGIDLTIEKGEFTSIAGPSGSGKTTLLNLVGCVDVPTSGDVVVAGHATRALRDWQLADLRLEQIGFIFQTFNLINVLDVRQNVAFPLLLQGHTSRAERRRRVDELVERVGLSDQARQRPNELSGGQRQRVAIARALVSRPALVLADEPTANLDSKTGGSIIELMKELNRTSATTFLFSTHDRDVMRHATRIVRIVDGRLDGIAAQAHELAG
jgi:putative ABC transport system ATP-binding protein